MGAPAAVADEEPSELLAYLNFVGPTPPPSPGVALRLRQATERAQKAGARLREDGPRPRIRERMILDPSGQTKFQVEVDLP